jgi:hypothetical protein
MGDWVVDYNSGRTHADNPAVSTFDYPPTTVIFPYEFLIAAVELLVPALQRLHHLTRGIISRLVRRFTDSP